MTTQNKRRIIGGVTATLVTIGLFWAYRGYAESSRIAEAHRLAAQLRDAPRGKNQDLQKKFRAQLAMLTPDQRMEVFEKGMDDRLDEYFSKTPAERKAYLDDISKKMRSRGFGGPPGKGQRPTAKGKGQTGTAKGKGQGGGQQARQGGGGGWGRQGGGPGGGRPRSTPEQRAQRRRERLDQTTPERRAKRAEFAAAMRARRGGGGGGFGGRR